ncbi:MAG: acyl-CoA desaturase [Candidatus Dormibacteraeota bacterium]|nr:acyl-CoA desaturase [Candidatus Dormibacteraeota bacterium]
MTLDPATVVAGESKSPATESHIAARPRPLGAAPSDYAVLKRRVREAGLLKKEPAYYVRLIVLNTIALAACCAVLVLFRNPWIQAGDAIILGLVSGQLGFQLHDAGHHQMFERKWKNVLVGFLTADVVLGMSYGWWIDKHNRHHANPNHTDLDPDINSPAIVYSVEQALQRRGVSRFIAKYQAWFFFPLICLQGWSMHVAGATFLARRSSRFRRAEVVTLLTHALLYLGILTWLLGPWSALLVMVLQKAAGGFYLATVFAPNHKGMLEVDEDSDLDFLRAQVLTSRNVRANRLTDFWYGSLNYQVEHHLFPTMARKNVPRAHGIVRQYCAEIGVPYHETSLLQSYRELLGFLHEVGAPLRRSSGLSVSGQASRPAPSGAAGREGRAQAERT